MKKLYITFTLTLFAFTLNAQTNVLHLNLGSHNEISDPAYGVNYQTNYSTIKSKTMQVADSVNVNGAKWNMQVESNFIKACIQFDNAATTSNDLMETMDNLSNVEVDPHNHLDTIIMDTNSIPNLGYNPYNYADLNHLLDSCGLSTRTNVGGFIYKAQDWETWDGDWTIWKNGLQGRTFPWVSWTPLVLWGGGTLNHVNDPQPIGVWHPGGPTTSLFLTNNPSQLLDIGNGCAWLIKDTTNPTNLLAEISNYITAINLTPPNSNTFYTATIMFDYRDILDAGHIDKISEVLRGVNLLVANGSVIWQTLTEKRTDWLNSHNNTSDNFIKSCSDISVGIENDMIEVEELVIYPSPANNFLIIQSETKKSINDIKLFNTIGTEINNINQIKNTPLIQLDISNLPSGMYFVLINISGQISIKKFIKN